MNLQLALLTGCVSFFSFVDVAVAQAEQVGTEPGSPAPDRAENSVTGFDEKLFDPETAERLNDALDRANRAIAACDKTAYQKVDEEWNGFETWNGYEERFGRDGIVATADDEREGGVEQIFLPTQRQRDAEVIYRNRNKFPEYPEADCNKKSETKTKIGNDFDPVTEEPDQPALSGSIMWAWESLDVPFAYLGYETGGEVGELDDYYCEIDGDQDACDRLANAENAARELPIVEGEDELALSGIVLGLDIPMGQWGAASTRPSKVAVSYAEGESTVTIGTVDAPSESGGRTLLPGPDGGESGASISNTSAFSSEFSDVVLNLDAKKWVFSASVPIFDGPSFIAPNIELQYDVYTAYRTIDWVAQIHGAIADYDGQFAYRTEIDQTAWDVFLSVAAVAPLGEGATLKIEAMGGPSLYDFEATDTLNFSVFDGDTTGGGTSQENADSEFKLTGRVRTELVFDLEDGVQVGAEGSFGNDFVPTAHRDGDEPTTYELEETERISVGFFARLRF